VCCCFTGGGRTAPLPHAVTARADTLPAAQQVKFDYARLVNRLHPSITNGDEVVGMEDTRGFQMASHMYVVGTMELCKEISGSTKKQCAPLPASPHVPSGVMHGASSKCALWLHSVQGAGVLPCAGACGATFAQQASHQCTSQTASVQYLFSLTTCSAMGVLPC
jgi:hypothetical protein